MAEHRPKDQNDSERFIQEQALIATVALDAVVTMDAAGLITSWNPTAESLFGWTRDEAVGRQLADLIIPPEHHQAHQGGLAHFLKTGVGPILGKRIEVTGLHRDRTPIDLELAISVMKLEDAFHFTAFLRDIGERKRHLDSLKSTTEELELSVQERIAELATKNIMLEKAQREAARRTRELQSYIDGMTMMNAKVLINGQIAIANEAAVIASGVPRHELIGSQFLDLEWCSFDPKVKARAVAAFDRAVGGEFVQYEEEILMAGQRGTIVLTLTPVRGATGKVEYIVAEGRDITPRKIAEQQLQRRTQELEVSNNELEAFSYSVSHDLRSPLRAMDGYSHAILTDYGNVLDDEAKQMLGRIRLASQRMGKLIDDLLNLSRVTRFDLHQSQVDLSLIANCVIDEFRQNHPERLVTVKVQPDVVVRGDPTLLKVLLENLMDNALKFSEPCSEALIEFGSAKGKSGVCYFVKDNGVGFDMAYANKLFGAFERLHSPSEFPGSGIGLATAKRIVARHGGEVWAESELGNGAIFYFTLGS